MKRTQIYLDESQDERLGRRAATAGVTKSTLIREAIDVYLRGDEDDAARLARFRNALSASAGIAPYLPDGGSYVASLHRADAARQEELDRRRSK